MSSHVELTLFFVLGPEKGGVFPAIILYGEGVMKAGKPKSRISKPQRSLGSGLYSLRSVMPLETLQSQLVGPEFASNDKRFILGLVARPPCLIPPASPHNDSPYARLRELSLMNAFVCEDKHALLARYFSADLARRGDEAKRLAAAVGRLAKLAGIDLWGRHARLLGDILLYEPRSTSEAAVILGWKFVRPGTAVEVRVDGERVAGRRLVLNLQFFGTDGEPVDDILHGWSAASGDVVTFAANQRVARACVRAWLDGSLVYHSDETLILEFSMDIDARGSSYTIADRLARFVANNPKHGRADAETNRAIQTVSPSAGESLTIGGTKDAWWAEEQRAGLALCDVLTPPAEVGSLFAEDGAGRGEAILHLLRWINASCEAWIVDPFFGEEAAEALLTRIEGECRLRIVTSLPPDSGETAEALKATLQRLPQWMLPANLEILQLARLDRSQAFHDRFIACMAADGSLTVHMLSNSLSGAARKYPLVVAPVPPRAALTILRDIEAAAGGSGSLFERPVERTTLWPIAGMPAPTAGAVLLRRHEPVPRMFVAEMTRAAPRRSWTHSDDGRWIGPDDDKQAIVRVMLGVDSRGGRTRGARSKPTRIREGRKARLLAGVWTLARLSTHGLDLSPRELAEHGLPAFVSVALARQLRQGLRRGAQPPARSMREAGIRAGLRLRPRGSEPYDPAPQLKLGLRLWADTGNHSEVSRGAYDRRFIWALLCWLNPARAVATAEATGDLGFITMLLDEQLLAAPFAAGLTEALLRSRWPALRGLAIQMIATPKHRQYFHSHPGPPDTDDALRSVLEAGLSGYDLLNVLSCWVQSVHPPASPRLVDTMVDLIEQQEPSVGQPFLVQTFDWPAPLRRRALRRMAGYTGLTKALVTCIAEAITHRSESVSTDMLFVAVRAVVTVARSTDQTPRAVFDEAIDVTALELAAMPASPLYRPPGHHRQVLAFVLAALWHDAAGLIAAGFDPPILDRGADAANRQGMKFSTERAQALRLNRISWIQIQA